MSKITPIVRSGLLLGLIALLGTALLAGVNALTHDRIVEQEKQRVLRQLNEIVPMETYNNDLLEDVIEISEPEIFRHPDNIKVYRARMNQQAVSLMMIVTAPDGYNGDIRLLIGIDVQGVVMGVRVISHRETPGLGDPIEAEKSNWIFDFNSKSLIKPGNNGWAVKKDGGEFDQFTGATISPRAIVRAVHTTLKYVEDHHQKLFETPSSTVSRHE